jgi:hypothetical protein
MATKKLPKQGRDGGSSPASCSVLEFDLYTGKKRYSGTVNVPDWDETCTLPMMVNSLMVNLAKDCPEIHEAYQMVFNCKLSKPNNQPSGH